MHKLTFQILPLYQDSKNHTNLPSNNCKSFSNCHLKLEDKDNPLKSPFNDEDDFVLPFRQCVIGNKFNDCKTAVGV